MNQTQLLHQRLQKSHAFFQSGVWPNWEKSLQCRTVGQESWGLAPPFSSRRILEPTSRAHSIRECCKIKSYPPSQEYGAQSPQHPTQTDPSVGDGRRSIPGP